MRGISDVLALLIVVGIAIAVGVTVANMVFSQISAVARNPSHIQLMSAEGIRLGTNVVKIKLTFSNPTTADKDISVISASLYTSGFTSQVRLQTSFDINLDTLRLVSGETGKLEFVVYTSSSSIGSGVIAVQIYVKDVASGRGYSDIILVPIR